MTDTLQILQPIVVDSLSVSTIPVDVNLVDSVNNIVLQFKDSIPVTFVDKTEHNWVIENLLGLIAFATTIISICFNIYQHHSANKERENSRKHDIELKKLETKEHRTELINKEGIERQYQLYSLLLELDDLATSDLARTSMTPERKTFLEKIDEIDIFIKKYRLYLSNKSIIIGEDLLSIYRQMDTDVDGIVWLGVLDLRDMYEKIFKDEESIRISAIQVKFDIITSRL